MNMNKRLIKSIEIAKMDKVIVYKGLAYYTNPEGRLKQPWNWRLSNRSRHVLAGSSEDFFSKAACIKNLERVTGGHFVILTKTEDGVAGVLQR